MDSTPGHAPRAASEPADRLLASLEPGHAYLVRAKDRATAIVAVRFATASLRRGESAALVVSRSPASEDVLQHFSGAGYNALAHIQSGRLLVVEFEGASLARYTPHGKLPTSLREFESQLKTLRPALIVFDAIQDLLAKEHDYSELLRFYNWATSFGATTLLIVSGERNDELVQRLKLLVRRSFRLEPAAPHGAHPDLAVLAHAPQDLTEEEESDVFRDLLRELLGDAADWLDLGDEPVRLESPPSDVPPAPAVGRDPAHVAEDLLRPSPARGGDSVSAAVEVATITERKTFKVVIVGGDPDALHIATHALADYDCAAFHEEEAGLAAIDAQRPDLIVMDVDLPIKEGFRILQRVRQSSEAPLIVLSGMYVRAADRLRSLELGADYYLVKPFSIKELRQKARLLIARHRGLTEWIVPPKESGPSIPYPDFVARVEESIRDSAESGQPFSLVGCGVSGPGDGRGDGADGLFQVVRSVVRSCDLISRNEQREIVVLLPEADTEGAKAFSGRLCGRAVEELKQPPVVWVRSYPVSDVAREPDLASERRIDRRTSSRRRPSGPTAGR